MTADLDAATGRDRERIERCKKILIDHTSLRNVKDPGVAVARILFYHRRQSPAFAAALNMYSEDILELAKTLTPFETLKSKENMGSVSNRELYHTWASQSQTIAFLIPTLEHGDPYFLNKLDHFQTVARDFRELQNRAGFYIGL